MARKPIIPIRADEETKARWQRAAGGTPLAEFIRAAVEEKIERCAYDFEAGGPKFTPEFSPSNPAIRDELSRGSATTTSTGGKIFKGPDPKGGKQK